MFWTKEKDLNLYRDVATQHVGNIADTRSVCVHVGILVNRHKKNSRDDKKIKAWGITLYEHSELYNA